MATATPGLTVPGPDDETYCVDVHLLITVFAAVLLALAWHGLADAALAQGPDELRPAVLLEVQSQASPKSGRK